jgi:hypothetical protein
MEGDMMAIVLPVVAAKWLKYCHHVTFHRGRREAIAARHSSATCAVFFAFVLMGG